MGASLHEMGRSFIVGGLDRMSINAGGPRLGGPLAASPRGCHEEVRVLDLDRRGDSPRLPVVDALHTAWHFVAKQLRYLRGSAKVDDEMPVGRDRFVFGFHANIKHHV